MPGPLLTPSNSASLWLLHQPQSAAAFPCFISQDVPGAAAKLLAGEGRAGSASVPFRAVFPYFELFGIIPVPGAAAEPSWQRVPPPALDAGNIPPSFPPGNLGSLPAPAPAAAPAMPEVPGWLRSSGAAPSCPFAAPRDSQGMLRCQGDLYSFPSTEGSWKQHPRSIPACQDDPSGRAGYGTLVPSF